jgi:hypothetical protein
LVLGYNFFFDKICACIHWTTKITDTGENTPITKHPELGADNNIPNEQST